MKLLVAPYSRSYVVCMCYNISQIAGVVILIFASFCLAFCVSLFTGKVELLKCVNQPFIFYYVIVVVNSTA